MGSLPKMMDKCKRCGQCCYIFTRASIFKRAEPTNIPCQYLIFNKDGTTTCSVYEDRKKKDLHPEHSFMVCGERKSAPFDYWGCPYNTGKKPMVKDHKIIKEI